MPQPMTGDGAASFTADALVQYVSAEKSMNVSPSLSIPSLHHGFPFFAFACAQPGSKGKSVSASPSLSRPSSQMQVEERSEVSKF